MSDTISLFLRDVGDPVAEALAFVECMRPLQSRHGRVALRLSHWRDGTVREEYVVDDKERIRSFFEKIPSRTSAGIEVYLHTGDDGDGVPIELYVRGEGVPPGHHGEHAGISFREKKDFWGDRTLLCGRVLDFSVVREICASFINTATPGTAWLCDKGEPVMPAACYLLYHRDFADFAVDAERVLDVLRNQHTHDRIFSEWLEASAQDLGAPEDFDDLIRAAARQLREPMQRRDPLTAATAMKGAEIIPTSRGLLLAGTPFFRHHVAGFFTAMLQGDGL